MWTNQDEIPIPILSVGEIAPNMFGYVLLNPCVPVPVKSRATSTKVPFRASSEIAWAQTEELSSCY